VTPVGPLPADPVRVAHKPAGHTAVSPYLIVEGAPRTLAFLAEVFGARELLRIARPDGSVMHAEVRIDDTVVMLGDPGRDWPAVGAHVHVYVPDVDDVYRRALAAGAEPVQAPARKDDPDRRGGFKDPGGTTWWVATRQA